MSELLYRIYSIQEQKFLGAGYLYYVDVNGNVIYLLDQYTYVEQEQFIIQRCTGEQDVNGKYIYEGDIVEVGKDIYTVEFSCGNFIVESLYTY